MQFLHDILPRAWHPQSSRLFMRRLDQLLSSLGYCSRKEVVGLVKAGRVKLKGVPLTKHDVRVDPHTITLDGEALEFMDYVVNGSRRMKDLISDLLAYSRINRIEIKQELVNCNVIINEVMQNLQDSIKGSGAKIEMEELPLVRA